MSRTRTISAPRHGTTPPDYLDLIKRFPIRALRSERDHFEAGAILDELIGRDDLSEGQRDYLEH
jgi:hypothetical protein